MERVNIGFFVVEMLVKCDIAILVSIAGRELNPIEKELIFIFKQREIPFIIIKNKKVLICEGCTHHRQCDDIGTVKLPKWIKEYTGKEPVFEWNSGWQRMSEI